MANANRLTKRLAAPRSILGKFQITKRPSAQSELICFDAKALQHREEEIAQRRPAQACFGENLVLAMPETTAREDAKTRAEHACGERIRNRQRRSYSGGAKKEAASQVVRFGRHDSGCVQLLLYIQGVAKSAEVTRIPRAFYFIDVGHGNATLIVSPSCETMLLNVGMPKLPTLLFHAQTSGSETNRLHDGRSFPRRPFSRLLLKVAEQMPIENLVDHGPGIESDESDDWWKQRRGPWFRTNMGKMYDARIVEYKAVLTRTNHVVVKAGDKIPIRG